MSKSRILKLLSLAGSAGAVVYTADHYHRLQHHQQKRNVGLQTHQFFGGLGAAAYFECMKEPLVEHTDQIEYSCPVRKTFNAYLQDLKNNEDILQSPMALMHIQMIEGQNNAQTVLLGEPLPNAVIEPFIKQILRHAIIDKEAREQGLPFASLRDHTLIDIDMHPIIGEAFREAGFKSGYVLHKVGSAHSYTQYAGHHFDETTVLDTDEIREMARDNFNPFK